MSSRAFLYTPFGGVHALHSAVGENMPRVKRGKEPHALLAPSADSANELELLRHTQVQTYKQTIASHQVLKEHVRSRYSPQDQVRAKQTTAYLISKAGNRLAKAMLPAFEQTRIANATVNFQAVDSREAREFPHLFGTVKSDNLYPSLHSGRPLENIGHKDKLYVLGHGNAPSAAQPLPALYAHPDMSGPSLTPVGLAKHLEQAGLPKDFKDLRITSCHAVSTQHGLPTDDGSSGRYFAPRLAQAVRTEFPQLTVTGYKRGGVTSPLGAHHERSDDGALDGRTRRSNEAARFPPL